MLWKQRIGCFRRGEGARLPSCQAQPSVAPPRHLPAPAKAGLPPALITPLAQQTLCLGMWHRHVSKQLAPGKSLTSGTQGRDYLLPLVCPPPPPELLLLLCSAA